MTDSTISIDESGVKSPIRLGQQKGSEGKRQIVGGHHRLASATDIDDKQLVPVLPDDHKSFGASPADGSAVDQASRRLPLHVRL